MRCDITPNLKSHYNNMKYYQEHYVYIPDVQYYIDSFEHHNRFLRYNCISSLNTLNKLHKKLNKTHRKI